MKLEKDIKILLDNDLDVDTLEVFGVKLGDSIEKINEKIIKDKFQYGTSWIGTNLMFNYRADEDSKSKVIEFLFYSDFLKELEINNTKTIIKYFGEPQTIEKKNSFHYYFYPARKMVVSWHAENKELFGIYIGENIIQQTKISAKEFLDKYFDFAGLVPDPNKWNEASLKGNDPRYYRFLELKSLMKTFNLGNDLHQDFTLCGFIKRRNHEDFKHLLEDIALYAQEDVFEKRRPTFKKEAVIPIKIIFIFQRFIKFCKVIRDTRSFNGGWLEASSVESRYFISKTNKLLQTIDQTQLTAIEDLLCTVIDPENKVFTQTELIKNFGYPDVNLEAIDLDNV